MVFPLFTRQHVARSEVAYGTVKATIVVITDELRTVVVDDPYKQLQDGKNTSTWTSIGPGGLRVQLGVRVREPRCWIREIQISHPQNNLRNSAG